MTTELKNAANWFEIPAIDIARARTFYETIFAIEMNFIDMGEFKMCLFPAPTFLDAAAARALVGAMHVYDLDASSLAPLNQCLGGD